MVGFDGYCVAFVFSASPPNHRSTPGRQISSPLSTLDAVHSGSDYRGRERTPPTEMSDCETSEFRFRSCFWTFRHRRTRRSDRHKCQAVWPLCGGEARPRCRSSVRWSESDPPTIALRFLEPFRSVYFRAGKSVNDQPYVPSHSWYALPLLCVLVLLHALKHQEDVRLTSAASLASPQTDCSYGHSCFMYTAPEV